VEQLLPSALQQGQPAGEADEVSITSAEPLGQPAIEAKQSASSTVRLLSNTARIVFSLNGSWWRLNRYEPKRQSQFFSSPQVSMDVPM
jgi:hypothetical protein